MQTVLFGFVFDKRTAEGFGKAISFLFIGSILTFFSISQLWIPFYKYKHDQEKYTITSCMLKSYEIFCEDAFLFECYLKGEVVAANQSINPFMFPRNPNMFIAKLKIEKLADSFNNTSNSCWNNTKDGAILLTNPLPKPSIVSWITNAPNIFAGSGLVAVGLFYLVYTLYYIERAETWFSIQRENPQETLRKYFGIIGLQFFCKVLIVTFCLLIHSLNMAMQEYAMLIAAPVLGFLVIHTLLLKYKQKERVNTVLCVLLTLNIGILTAFLCVALGESAFFAAIILISSTLFILSIASCGNLSFLQLSLIALLWGSIFGGSMAFWIPIKSDGVSVVGMLGAVVMPLIVVLNLRQLTKMEENTHISIFLYAEFFGMILPPPIPTIQKKIAQIKQ